MLKQRDLHECYSLYNLMVDPVVYPYVRYKCQSVEEYLFMTKQLIVEEEQKTCISRTILSEMGQPIGTIDLYHIAEHTGFLATWIGAPYFGQGYNRRAKESFLAELFLDHQIETVFMKIRTNNVRSKRAVEKLSFVRLANDIHPEVYQSINKKEQMFDLYHVERADFLAYLEDLREAVGSLTYCCQ